MDFNLEVNSLRLNEFFISSFIELKILGPWNRRENFRTLVLQEGRRKKIFSGIIVVYFSSSEKHVFETFRELAVFVYVHNFGYLKKNDILIAAQISFTGCLVFVSPITGLSCCAALLSPPVLVSYRLFPSDFKRSIIVF